MPTEYSRSESDIKMRLKAAAKNDNFDSSLMAEAHAFGARLSIQNNYTDAAEIYKLLLEMQEKHLGSNHPDLANSLEYLALVVYENGDKIQAMTLNYRALALRQTVS